MNVNAIILAAVFILTSTLSFAQVQLPPGTVLPSPGDVRPPSLNQPWRPVDGPPALPRSAPLILVPQNQFLLPPASPPKIECTREVGADFTVCKIY
jgi:hypothetical protein